jgi:hypothetical protein
VSKTIGGSLIARANIGGATFDADHIETSSKHRIKRIYQAIEIVNCRGAAFA